MNNPTTHPTNTTPTTTTATVRVTVAVNDTLLQRGHQDPRRTAEASAAYACPSARRSYRSKSYPVLDAVEQAFTRLCADPQTPRVRTSIGQLPLSIVRSVLADPATSDQVADGIWRTLIGRARGHGPGPEWLLAAVGCALPRIRSGLRRATRDRRVDRDEVAQAALTAYAEAVLGVDPIPETGVLDELVRHARYAAKTVADRVERDWLSHRPLPRSVPPLAPAGRVDFVLADLAGFHRIERTS